jgi:glycosyltransferase involved in cell wall biosynthesis
MNNNKNNNMDIIFIGGFISENVSFMHHGFSQAANLYQKKCIDFLQPVLAISVLPLFFNCKVDFDYHYKNVKFINHQSGLKNKLNYLYRLIFDTLALLNILRNTSAKNVILYNIDLQNSLSIILIKYLLKRKVYIIIADYCFYTKKLSNRIHNYLLKIVNGTIVLNSNIKCNQNSKQLSGLLYKEQIELKLSGVLNNNVLFSGALGKTTGMELALDYFSVHPEFTLYITGGRFQYTQNEFERMMKKYVKFSNIKFLGMLDYEEYLNIMKKCDIALSLRKQDDEEHNYNFPSKILEYLSKSKMVISTFHYKDIDENLLFYSEYDIDSFDKTLKSIYILTADDILRKRRNISSYLENNFTKEKFLKVVKALLNG